MTHTLGIALLLLSQGSAVSVKRVSEPEKVITKDSGGVWISSPEGKDPYLATEEDEAATDWIAVLY